jgi:uncharacterized protein
MWVATWRSPRALQLVFFALWVTFFLLAAGEWTGLAVLHHTGGYGGLVTAALAFYLSAAEIINETHGRTVLPVGPAQDASAATVIGLPLRMPAIRERNPATGRSPVQP